MPLYDTALLPAFTLRRYASHRCFSRRHIRSAAYLSCFSDIIGRYAIESAAARFAATSAMF